MKKLIYIAASLAIAACNPLFAQDFQTRVGNVAAQIAEITAQEKSALAEDVASVNQALINGEITEAEAEAQKLVHAEQRSAAIERRTALVHEELKALIQQKVDGVIDDAPVADPDHNFNITVKRDSTKKKHGELRTTSQFVLAFGLNHLLTDGAMAHSDFRVWGSRFFEWGVTYNTRIFKNHNLLHAKYGVSLQYNTLRPTDNRYFAVEGRQTNLVTSDIALKDSRFRALNLVVPVHLEFDFTKVDRSADKPRFKTHDSFRLGIGGYAGANVKTKQVLQYKDENGNRVRERTRGDFNASDFVYGLSAYVGYGEVSLYAKYDLNPFFEHNAIDQHNLSMGLRLDFN